MKIKKSEKGVSEVVGSILILAITVTMFAVVMLWVISYPTPSGRAYVDLNAEVNGQYVNITHTGGESLEDQYTAIYVYINGSLAGSKSYKISDADNYATIGNSLSVGETWSKTFSISSTSTVYVMVVDTEGNEVIYDETIQGVSGNNPPVVAFACTVPSSVPADGSTTFKVYAYILDPDKDVSTATVNLSSVGKSTYSMTSTDGVIFQKSSLTIPVGTSAGRYLCQINATDSNSNTATGYVWITVIDPSVLGGGGFASEGSSYGDQGFMITNDFNSTADIRIFNQTDTIWVKMASNVLTNVKIKNIFTMKDVYGNILTPPTSNSAFVYYNYDGGYYFYVYSFDAQNIQEIGDDGGVYPTHIELKDYSGHVFIVDTTIIVKDINGGIPTYGILKTYSNAAYTTESSWFDSEGMMYVKVFTKTVGDADSATVGNIEIRDFIGGAQVKRRPGNEPVSNITIVDGNYSFSINFSNANQDPWLHPGNNTYTLFVRNFTDSDESYQNLALQVIIYAPPKMLDIIAGIDEAQDPAWATKDYLYFYENDNYWTRTCLDHDPDNVVSILDVAVGDMDEDGDLDVVGGAEAKYVYLYDNLKGDGSKWNRTLIDDLTSTGEKPWCVEVGDMNGDGAIDVVVGTDSKKVYVYLNDGAWTRSTVSTGEDVYSIALGDFDGDGSLDIAVGRSGGAITVFLNNGNGTFRGDPGTPTDDYATDEWTAEGSVTGSRSNTTSSDNDYENLTEEQGGVVGGVTNDTTASDYNTVYGTITSGDHTDTHTSDDGYEVIQEEAGSDAPVIHKVLGEVDASIETKTNDYTWTMDSDDLCESLREGKSGNKYYLGDSPYHYWDFGVLSGGVWAEVVDLCIESEIVEGTEWFEIGYSTDASTITWVGNISRTSEGWNNFTLPVSLRSQQVYIHIRDDTDDTGDNDPGTSGDAGYTSISIDYMYIKLGCTSKLEHNWTVLVSGGDDVTVYVEANHSADENISYTGGDTDANLAGWFPGWDGDPAQSFTTVDAISVSSVELYLKRETADPSDVYLEIRSDSTVGSVLGTSNTIDSAALSTSYGWTEFIFVGQVDLSSSTKYYLRLCSDPPSTDPFNPAETLIYWGFKQTALSPYAGGEAWRYVGRNNNPGDQGQELTQYDFSFKVWVNNDGDDFVFEYSTDGSTFTEMFTVRKVIDNDTYQSYSDAILDAFSGTLYIRVKDTNRSLSHTNLDSVYVDRISVCSTTTCTANSSLEHCWSFAVTGGGDVIVWIEAWHTANAENDNFTFYYSTDNNTYTPMFNVTSTTDPNTYQTYSDATLDAHSGPLWIKAVDTDDATGNYTLDSLYVDHMFVRSTSAGTEWINITAGSDTINCLATADLDGDGSTDIAAGDSGGIVWQCINDGTGKGFTVSQVANAGSAVNGIGIGSLTGTSKLDIAVGTSGGKVYVYDNGTGTWTATEVASTGVTIYDLAVGDMESDGDDDIVIATGSGQTIGGVHYYENDGNWTGTSVDNCETPVFCVTVGDIDG